MTLQVPNASFAGIAVNQFMHRRRDNLQALCWDSVFTQLFWQQVAGCYLILFLVSIAAEGNHIHSIQQRRGNRAVIIRRGNEHDLAQVKRHVDIMVIERAILLRIQYLKQCGGRIPLVTGAQLINFIQ